jgi:hypothetical protein
MGFVIRYSHSDRDLNGGLAYHALHGADEQTVENLTRLVGVADILEGLGTVLATDVQKDFLTTAVEYSLADCHTCGRVWQGIEMI